MYVLVQYIIQFIYLVSCLGADIESALKEKIIAKIDSMKSA